MCGVRNSVVSTMDHDGGIGMIGSGAVFHVPVRDLRPVILKGGIFSSIPSQHRKENFVRESITVTCVQVAQLPRPAPTSASTAPPPVAAAVVPLVLASTKLTSKAIAMNLGGGD